MCILGTPACRTKTEDLVAQPLPTLQVWVRSAILSDRKKSATFERFVKAVVEPACRCNIGSVPKQMDDICAKFKALLLQGDCDEQTVANIKVATAAITGSFDQHPMILGLALQCKRQMEKLQKGQENMTGRRTAESERESQLIRDAGIQLAAASGNSHLAAQFGLSKMALRTKMEELREFSLPVPALSLLWPDVLKDNFAIADTRYPMAQGSSKRYLANHIQYITSEYIRHHLGRDWRIPFCRQCFKGFPFCRVPGVCQEDFWWHSTWHTWHLR